MDSFSSLFIGIVAATTGSQTSQIDCPTRFSSLFIGIVAATMSMLEMNQRENATFQFPIHWDCGCNTILHKLQILRSLRFQFPIHWDCGCNGQSITSVEKASIVSVPYSLGLWLQPRGQSPSLLVQSSFSSLFIGIVAATRKKQILFS